MKNDIRTVGSREIYDSYMGILRISPDENYVDDITDQLKNPENEIELTDSDGNPIGTLHFKPCIKKTTVKIDGESNNVNLVYVESKCEKLTAVKNFNVRNFFILKKNENIDKKSNLTVVNMDNTVDTIQLVAYPIESPHDDTYFNSNRDIITGFDYTPGNLNKDRYEKIENYLFNRSKDWYEKKSGVLSKHFVKVGNKIIHYPNVDNEPIPALYTHDCVLGHYEGHNIAIQDKSDVTNWVDDDKNAKFFTKLSWIDLDKLIWDEIDGTIQGDTRHHNGRYTSLGVDLDNTESLIGKNKFFGSKKIDNRPNQSIHENGDGLLYKTAPLLGVSFQPRYNRIYSSSIKTFVIPHRKTMYHK